MGRAQTNTDREEKSRRRGIGKDRKRGREGERKGRKKEKNNCTDEREDHPPAHGLSRPLLFRSNLSAKVLLSE
jgi:hypothetical protein